MMSTEKMKKLLHERATLVEAFVSREAHNPAVPERLTSAMRYSLDAGGKRLRPVLCLTVACMCGLDVQKALPFATAIEMIHTYSLIHDDLPAMDNDDLRRGKPSNHKAFDEATAILSGDGLLTDAFFMMTQTPVAAEALLPAIAEMAQAAGSAGMVGGQMWDMLFTGQSQIAFDELRLMHSMKTGALIRASCLCGAILACAGSQQQKDIALYGQELGVAFQIADDILDVTADTATLGKPAASDVAQGKNTYPSMFGLEKSRELAIGHCEKAQQALAGFTGKDADFLVALAAYSVTRAN